MKSSYLILPFLLVSLHLAAAEKPSSYDQGMAAIAAGEPDKAQAFFLKALEENPNNPHARFQLGQVRKNASAIGAKGRAARFNQIVVAKIALDKATLQEALEYLASQVTKSTNESFTPNFLILDQENAITNKEITLTLNNIPAKAALDYILSQAGAKAKFEEHAIVIRPIGS